MVKYYEKNGHTAFRSNSGKEYFLPEPAAFEDIPHFKLTHKQGTNDCLCFYECDELNRKGERIVVELSFCQNFDGKSGLPKAWYKSGMVDHIFESYWVLNTYVYDEKGRCYGAYNPTEMTYRSKPDNEGHVSVRPVIDFDWKLDATRENALALFAEAYRRFMACEPRRVVGDEYFRRDTK